jgi:hypothetical protein
MTLGKSRKEPKMQSPKEVEAVGSSSACNKDQGGRTGNPGRGKREMPEMRQSWPGETSQRSII